MREIKAVLWLGMVVCAHAKGDAAQVVDTAAQLPGAAGVRLATQMHVPPIDLQSKNIVYLDKLRETGRNGLAITTKAITTLAADGSTIPEGTHLNPAGNFVFGRLTVVDPGKAVPVLAKSVLPNPAALRAADVQALKILNGAPVTIVLVGDSTVATGGGWGPGFCKVMTANVTCLDVALNGRSSKSFIDEGAWAKALALHGDYYLIQFGHNDQKPDAARHTDPDGAFQVNLKRYVADVCANGAIPVLVTPLSRRTMKDGTIVEDLHSYAAATRKVGAEEGITVIDLNSLSTALLNHMTQAQADRFDMVDHPDEAAENGAHAKLDRTHLNALGQEIFGRMVADQLRGTALASCRLVKNS
jgi:lysophospholipase L1-like esterase